ncbi:hypothetical protein SARC_06059 [Sphaeroforma arctica JP610]|uniref:Uncharacterized protein n=1 Tax=Sphaeroforma arctica JP610 TaxID=667725 RepID=A0A0L0FYJ8_9EUKA|nr:hypothetical protein SARC_06059 [Sphaeroforma arctica JP610]KNC81621.1 hypothetical protein SARC_06059 [Sphaeroforma arctica JP610]|eukprot:XP_014155523.1 hypothetical protein SARC_06059 [Sphaeroforma arctica JP610]
MGYQRPLKVYDDYILLKDCGGDPELVKLWKEGRRIAGILDKLPYSYTLKEAKGKQKRGCSVCRTCDFGAYYVTNGKVDRPENVCVGCFDKWVANKPWYSTSVSSFDSDSTDYYESESDAEVDADVDADVHSEDVPVGAKAISEGKDESKVEAEETDKKIEGGELNEKAGVAHADEVIANTADKDEKAKDKDAGTGTVAINSTTETAKPGELDVNAVGGDGETEGALKSVDATAAPDLERQRLAPNTPDDTPTETSAVKENGHTVE